MGTGTLCLIAYSYKYYQLIVIVGILTMASLVYRKLTFKLVEEEFNTKMLKRDLNIKIYNFCITTMICSVFRVPLIHISPLYFSEPIGAIVGENLKKPSLSFGSKKAISSIFAAFIMTFITLSQLAKASFLDAIISSLLLCLC
jgi:dolichol kinase